MASIQKRVAKDGSTSYRVMIRVKGFPTESATFARLTDAREWAARVEADMKAGRHLGAPRMKTLGELLDRYEAAVGPHRKSWASFFKPRLDWWRAKLGDALLKDVTPQRIAELRDELLAMPKQKGGKPRTGADVARALAVLSSALTFGVKELGWLQENPARRVTKPKESPPRIRFLADDELPRLLAALKESPHPDLYPAALLALTTGARSGEILGLRWGQIDFANGTIALRHGETKNDQGRILPLADDVAALLKERAKVRRIDDDRVFPPPPGCKALNLRDGWKAALVAANIDVETRPYRRYERVRERQTSAFRWHDLRHCAASYLTMAGVGAIEVARVLGHKTLAMTLRYSHLAPGRVKELGEVLAKKVGGAQ